MVFFTLSSEVHFLANMSPSPEHGFESQVDSQLNRRRRSVAEQESALHGYKLDNSSELAVSTLSRRKARQPKGAAGALVRAVGGKMHCMAH